MTAQKTRKPTVKQVNAITKMCRCIEAAAELPAIDEMAKALGWSRFHFQRIFKQVTGITPKAYLAARRAERLRTALPDATNIADAIYDAGYNAASRFYEEAEAQLGMKPQQYRLGGKDAHIRFAIAETSLGPLLVAATTKGLCAVAFGDDPQSLLQDFQNRFAAAELIGGEADFENWVARLVGYVEKPSGPLDLPLDVRGTLFQQRVWQALRAIPAGSTASYSDIAEAIGQPGAARAVARACASNPAAIAIPCHRVVRADGGLSGYRWGVARKKTLIARESASDGRT